MPTVFCPERGLLKFSIKIKAHTGHLFLRFYSILPESRDLIGFYCRASMVYNVMRLVLMKNYFS